MQTDPLQILALHGTAGGNEYAPQSISASPPFHSPSTNLLSTSPSTTVLGGIGMHSVRDFLISGGNRARTSSGEKGYDNSYSHKYQGGSPQANSSTSNVDMLTLTELPVNPFESSMSAIQHHGGGGDLDERSVNTGTITDGDKGNADTDGMFDFEETEALDDDGDVDEIVEDMPFAWAQQSSADSYVFNKSGISHMPDVSSDGTMTGHSNMVNSGGPSSGMMNLNQSFIAQQCMAPPVLMSFQQNNEDQRSMNFSNDMVC